MRKRIEYRTKGPDHLGELVEALKNASEEIKGKRYKIHRFSSDHSGIYFCISWEVPGEGEVIERPTWYAEVDSDG